ncbi:hypothetical protein BH09SUM1_BH09SUM1_11500 [soil metagenome]
MMNRQLTMLPALALCAALIASCAHGETAMKSTTPSAAKSSLPSPTDANASVPWEVFADTSAAHEQPLSTAPAVKQYAKGDHVVGAYYLNKETDEEWIEFAEAGKKVYVPRCDVNRLYPGNAPTGDLPYGEETVNRWFGIPLTYEPSDLVTLDEKYAAGSKGEYELRKEASDALAKMLDDARAEGIDIRVTSAYRAGMRQKSIYQRNNKKDGPSQRYSAPPGHSEHQLGTTVDLVDAEQKHVFSRQFNETPQGAWLEENAVNYGFVRSYQLDNIAETGYISEPWHWRYQGVGNAQKIAAERRKRGL